jgi:hypothetical protein
MDFFYEGYITDKSSRRHGDGSREPVPGKKGRKKKESIVLHLNSHKYLKGDNQNDGKKERIQ